MLTLVISLAPLGCQKHESSAPDHINANDSGPVEKTAEKGPVKMSVRVPSGSISLAERLKLSIEVTAEPNVDVEMPQFGSEMSEFAIRDFRDWPSESVQEGRRWRQEYELDVFVSGVYGLPAMTAKFVDRRKGPGEEIEGEISTEPLEITVVSLLEGEFDPTTFKDIKLPVALPRSATWRWLMWVGAGVAGAGVLAAAITWYVRRRRRPVAEWIVPPHEWAFDQLQMLIDEQLVEQGLVHEFYFRLSMIVRTYIERRFEVMAPERTTEEFLAEIRRGLRLPVEYRGMLGDFLTACDQVKFALYQPTAAEIEQVFNAARDFIDRTAERETQATNQVAA